jgi:hypothetical protein
VKCTLAELFYGGGLQVDIPCFHQMKLKYSEYEFQVDFKIDNTQQANWQTETFPHSGLVDSGPFWTFLKDFVCDTSRAWTASLFWEKLYIGLREIP